MFINTYKNMLDSAPTPQNHGLTHTIPVQNSWEFAMTIKSYRIDLHFNFKAYV